jgi:hypothetical protein
MPQDRKDHDELRLLREDSIQTLERVRKEIILAIEGWSIFESANGYPRARRRIQLFEKVNRHDESWGISKVRQLAINETILALNRVTDSYNPKNTNHRNRRTFARIKHFLLMGGCKEFLISEASWYDHVRVISEFYPQVLARIEDERNTETRSVVWLRKLIRDMRNETLAHALDETEGKRPRFYDVRDGLVLTADLVHKLELMIRGNNWDPKDVWRASFKKAEMFWDRYENGYLNEP